MKLFKSIFWLSIAYLAIGPQVNAVEAVQEFSRQTVTGGGQVLSEQMDRVACQDIACVGGKMAVAHALEMLPDDAEARATELTLPANIPFPRPPLDRT